MSEPGLVGVYFTSGGFRLLGTLFLAQGDGPKPTVVLLHGMPGIEKNYDLALGLRKAGWNSLVFHYRGCWGSEGVFTFKSIPIDVIAALDMLRGDNCLWVNPERIVLFGHSLGGWAAILAGVMDKRVRGVVAAAPIANPVKLNISLPAAAEEFCPWLPGLTPECFVEQWQQLGSDFTPIDKVSQLAPRPILIIHGAKDELVLSKHSDELYARASEPAKYVVHPDADHGFCWHRDWLQQTILSWLSEMRI